MRLLVDLRFPFVEHEKCVFHFSMPAPGLTHVPLSGNDRPIDSPPLTSFLRQDGIMWASVGAGLLGLFMASMYPLAMSLLPSAGEY